MITSDRLHLVSWLFFNEKIIIGSLSYFRWASTELRTMTISKEPQENRSRERSAIATVQTRSRLKTKSQWATAAKWMHMSALFAAVVVGDIATNLYDQDATVLVRMELRVSPVCTREVLLVFVGRLQFNLFQRSLPPRHLPFNTSCIQRVCHRDTVLVSLQYI